MSVKRYDFDENANGYFDDSFMKECEKGEFVLHSDYAALEALLARHDALREAVAWERECCQDIRPLTAWADLYARHGEDYVDAIAEALREIQDAARAEVDRLIANEGDDK